MKTTLSQIQGGPSVATVDQMLKYFIHTESLGKFSIGQCYPTNKAILKTLFEPILFSMFVNHQRTSNILRFLVLLRTNFEFEGCELYQALAVTKI